MENEDKEVFTVDVRCYGAEEVKGATGEACMIFFDGSASGPYFEGTVLQSAVDTQKQKYGQERFLSARYIIKGKDFKGNDVKVFVENNGSFCADGSIITHPMVLTDSKDLAFLETTPLYGTIEGQEGGVIIHVFAKSTL